MIITFKYGYHSGLDEVQPQLYGSTKVVRKYNCCCISVQPWLYKSTITISCNSHVRVLEMVIGNGEVAQVNLKHYFAVTE